MTNNLCIDIVSRMSALLNNFNANAVGSTQFSHDSGFSAGQTPAATSTAFTDFNEAATTAFIGLMAMLWLLTQAS